VLDRAIEAVLKYKEMGDLSKKEASGTRILMGSA